MIRILKASKQTDGMDIADIGEKMSKTQMSVFIDEKENEKDGNDEFDVLYEVTNSPCFSQKRIKKEDGFVPAKMESSEYRTPNSLLRKVCELCEI